MFNALSHYYDHESARFSVIIILVLFYSSIELIRRLLNRLIALTLDKTALTSKLIFILICLELSSKTNSLHSLTREAPVPFPWAQIPKENHSIMDYVVSTDSILAITGIALKRGRKTEMP